MQTTQQQLQALYVAWQQPQSRRYYPVARLVAGAGDANDLYEFAYINGALEAAKDGFQPFPAFPNLREIYRSDQLFPFFSNRLMSPNRPDFSSYIRSLGLDLNADPMLILARSGGTRATDSIELFPIPARTSDQLRYQTFFWMHGFRYLDTTQQTRLLSLQPGEKLLTSSQTDNEIDPNAIRLLTTDKTMLGYVPRYLASDAIQILNAGVQFDVFVERVNPPPVATQQRLLCRLDASWPDNFRPFATDTYQPILPDAADLHQF